MSSRARRFSWASGAMAIVLVFAAAWAAAPGVSGAPGQQVVFYSGLQREITEALVRDFESKNRGIRVEVFQAPIEALLQKMELEIRASRRIQADVIWTGDRLILDDFKKRGLLEKYLPSDVFQVSPSLRDPDGFWAATVPLGLYIMYNKNQVTGSAIPASWKDLTDPRWQNKIALSDPAVSGTAAVLVAALVQQYGWSYWQAIGRGRPLVSPSTVSLLNVVVSGERQLVPMVDFLVWQSLKQGKPVGVVSPKDGVPVTHIIAALVKDARNPEPARKLVNYLVSLDAAKLQAAQGFYHTRRDAPVPAGMPTLDKVKFMYLDWNKYAREKDQIKENFRQILQR